MSAANSGKSRSYHHGDLRRALIDAAVAIVSEDQDWDFSLREVARRAGVSHNAPYNHFPDKRNLLDAVAAVGFESLRADMRSAMARDRNAATALISIARAYVKFAARNPALYRLMFGSELAQPDGIRPELAEAAGAGAKMVLQDVILRGAEEKLFAVDVTDASSVAMAILSVWAAVHGLAFLIIDNKSGHPGRPEQLVDGVMRHFVDGLRKR